MDIYFLADVGPTARFDYYKIGMLPKTAKQRLIIQQHYCKKKICILYIKQ